MKNRLIIISSLFVALVVFAVITLRNQQPPPDPIIDLQQVKPGQTELGELVNIPNQYHQTQSNNITHSFFGNNAPQQYTEIIASSGVVIGIKLTNPSDFEFLTFPEFVQSHGSHQLTKPTSWSEYGYSAYIYSQLGKIIVAHTNSGEIIEEWIITPNPSNDTLNQLLPPPPPIEGN